MGLKRSQRQKQTRKEKKNQTRKKNLRRNRQTRRRLKGGGKGKKNSLNVHRKKINPKLTITELEKKLYRAFDYQLNDYNKSNLRKAKKLFKQIIKNKKEGKFNESEMEKANDIEKSAKGALFTYGITVNNNDQPEEYIQHTISAGGNDVYAASEEKRVLDIGKVGDLVKIYKGDGQQHELHEIIVKEDGNKDLELITSSGRNGRYA